MKARGAFDAALVIAIGVVSMAAVMLLGLTIPGALRGVPHVLDAPSSAGWFFGEIPICALAVTFVRRPAGPRRGRTPG